MHDGYVFCPNDRLVFGGQYCGASADPETCRRCLSELDLADFSVTKWRKDMAQEFGKCDLIIFPSNSNKSIYERIYPLKNYRIVPHGIPLPLKKAKPGIEFSIAFLGYADPAKGERLIKSIVPRLAEANIVVHLIGANWEKVSYEDLNVKNRDRVFIHGTYNDRFHLYELLSRIRPSVICLLSTGHESFGYTLSEVWAAGFPAIVPPHSAMAERVEKFGAGLILERLDEDTVCEAVLSLREDGSILSKLQAEAAMLNVRSIGEMTNDYEKIYSDLFAATVEDEHSDVIDEILFLNSKQSSDRFKQFTGKIVDETERVGLQSLLEIYMRRPDLRKAYPEVQEGHLTSLKNWAISVIDGRFQDPDSDTLTPFRDAFVSKTTVGYPDNSLKEISELVSNINPASTVLDGRLVPRFLRIIPARFLLYIRNMLRNEMRYAITDNLCHVLDFLLSAQGKSSTDLRILKMQNEDLKHHLQNMMSKLDKLDRRLLKLEKSQ